MFKLIKKEGNASLQVTIKVKNEGNVAGKEVAQIYVAPKTTTDSKNHRIFYP